MGDGWIAGLLLLIRRYTREAGVRNLERELSNLVRRPPSRSSRRRSRRSSSQNPTCPDYLGAPKYRFGEFEAEDMVVRSQRAPPGPEVGRRVADDRGRDDAPQGQDDRHWQYCVSVMKGIDFRRGLLCPLAGHRFRHRAAFPSTSVIFTCTFRRGRRPKDGPSAGYAMGDGRSCRFLTEHCRAARYAHDRAK